jgi:hypothetical protein
MARFINIAYYRKEDWSRFIESIDDKMKMQNKWEEWHADYLKTKTTLILHGFTVKDVIVDINELKDYCKERGIKNDGSARSQFVIGK